MMKIHAKPPRPKLPKPPKPPALAPQERAGERAVNAGLAHRRGARRIRVATGRRAAGLSLRPTAASIRTRRARKAGRSTSPTRAAPSSRSRRAPPHRPTCKLAASWNAIVARAKPAHRRPRPRDSTRRRRRRRAGRHGAASARRRSDQGRDAATVVIAPKQLGRKLTARPAEPWRDARRPQLR